MIGTLEAMLLNCGEGISFGKTVVLEICLLRRIVHFMGKTFSRNFVRDVAILQIDATPLPTSMS